MKRNPSIIQDEKYCYFTGYTEGLDPHEPIGGSNKRNSEQDGLWIWCTRKYHRWLHDTEEGKKRNKELQAEAQQIYMDYYNKTEEEFRARYFKSYL